MSKIKRNSMVEMLAKVPVTGTRGSLLTAIDKLLKTIEVSESAIMIPTLLRDKCEFDASELLIIAKIIKASILGHSDLVEFYMSNIDHQDTNENNQEQPSSDTYNLNSSISSPTTALMNGTNHNQNSSNSLSPSSNPKHHNNNQQQQPQTSVSASGSPILKHHQSNSSTNTIIGDSQQQQPHSLSSMGLLSLSSDGSSLGGLNMKLDTANTNSISLVENPASSVAPTGANNISGQQQQQQSKVPQPPSLLQLTTNNNHMNQQRTPQSIMGDNNNPSTSHNNEVGTSNDQMSPLQSPSHQAVAGNSSGYSTGESTPASSVSGTNVSQANNSSSSNSNSYSSIISSTSFNGNIHIGLNRTFSSGAMSPYTSQATTPVTPYPQAETMFNGRHVLPGDPNASAKLLSQIEQLKVSISNVTNMLESVVDLYKNYVDNIA